MAGGTDRGCIEAPHLTRRGEFYYIMCAEGGTGYNHCVTMGRSRNVWGPYEGDPMNPIVTSVPGESYERQDPDHLKPRYFNPDSVLQKSGHGSYVNLPTGGSVSGPSLCKTLCAGASVYTGQGRPPSKRWSGQRMGGCAWRTKAIWQS